MADLLTHVLTGYCIGLALTFRYDWMGSEHVTLVMVGAVTPDLSKGSMIIADETVETALGIPFSWDGFHTIGGSVVIAFMSGLLIATEYRRAAILLLFMGAISHHVLDLLILQPSGYGYQVLWPLTEYRPPAGMLYLSSDRWPAMLAGTVAVVLRIVKRRLENPTTSEN